MSEAKVILCDACCGIGEVLEDEPHKHDAASARAMLKKDGWEVARVCRDGTVEDICPECRKPREPKEREPSTLTIELSKQAIELLGKLVGTGLYGPSVEHAASRFVDRGILECVEMEPLRPRGRR